LVLEANELRYQAHLKEQEAIQKMEKIINDTFDSSKIPVFDAKNRKNAN